MAVHDRGPIEAALIARARKGDKEAARQLDALLAKDNTRYDGRGQRPPRTSSGRSGLEVFPDPLNRKRVHDHYVELKARDKRRR